MVIDTPGFMDSRGIERDNKLKNILKPKLIK